jgi:hypothetical protein
MATSNAAAKSGLLASTGLVGWTTEDEAAVRPFLAVNHNGLIALRILGNTVVDGFDVQGENNWLIEEPARRFGQLIARVALSGKHTPVELRELAIDFIDRTAKDLRVPYGYLLHIFDRELNLQAIVTTRRELSDCRYFASLQHENADVVCRHELDAWKRVQPKDPAVDVTTYDAEDLGIEIDRGCPHESDFYDDTF